MKQVKNQKSYLDTLKWTSMESEKTFFLVLTQSEKSLLAYTAHTLAKIKCYVSGTHKKKILFLPSSPLPIETLCIKIIKIEEIENLTLGHLLRDMIWRAMPCA